MRRPKLPPIWKRTWPLALLIALAISSARLSADAKDDAPAPAPKNVAELRAIESRVQEVAAKVLPSVVGVQIGAARGSGVIVSEDGFVMTAGHVVGKPGQPVTFYFADGKTAKGKTLGAFKTADAGLMKIEDPGKYPFVEKARSAQLKPGSWCVALGHPMGYQKERPPVVRVGRVLRAGDRVIQTDCPLVGGDSGGPLFDLDGKVIGIHSRIGGSTNMNFHVPVDVFHDNWDRLVKSELWEADMPGRNCSQIKVAMREAIVAAGKCTVRIKCDGKETALGTIVGPDGWIITKASQLKGKIACLLRDKRELEAARVGVHEAFDLAMLKVDALDLPGIEWNRASPAVGQWVAAPGPGDDPLALGVVSVPQRKIPAISGILGVLLGEGEHGAPIEKILPGSPAEKIGLKVSDVITHVNGKATPNRKELIATVKSHRPGEVVKLKVKRGDKTLEFSPKLATLDTPAARKRKMQNSMGVGVSKRRDAFPMVLQHDMVLRPADCGGPLVDLDGKVVGINIARGGRTETYTVPADVLLGLMYDLMSGRLTPPDIKKKREEKAAAEKAAAEKAAAEKAAAEKAAAEKAAAEKKAEEERKKAEAEKKAEEERKKAEAEKKAEEERKKAEAEKKAEEERKKAEAEKKPEEERKKAEAEKKAEEERKKAEAEKKPEEEQKKE